MFALTYVTLIAIQIILCVSAPAPTINQLTEEQVQRIAKWAPGDNQNPWEMSGQLEGDIILQPDGRNGLINTRYRWPGATLVYQFDPAVTQQQRQLIISSLDDFTKYTCVKHKARTNENDFIYVTNVNTGCWSMVGRTGDRQELNLQANGCMYKGTIIHEFTHALGFYHQQSATERDNFVGIIWDNIQEGKEHNFDKYDANYITNLGTKYDYGSLMHYSAYAFSKNGQKTIQTLNNEAIGQSVGLSNTDIVKINKMYC